MPCATNVAQSLDFSTVVLCIEYGTAFCLIFTAELKDKGTAFSRICLSVCLHSKRKTASAISTKVGRLIVHGRTSASTDPEVKRSKVKS